MPVRVFRIRRPYICIVISIKYFNIFKLKIMSLNELNKESSEDQLEVALQASELLNVEGGEDSDMDDCKAAQCIAVAVKCYTGA